MKTRLLFSVSIVGFVLSLTLAGPSQARDLSEIKASKVLRHIGVPYANFVTGSDDGLDVELARMFAQSLGVRYEYVESSFKSVVGDLTGKQVKASGEDITVIGDVPVKGDLIASGLTVLPWRRKIVDYSDPIFPTQVWVLARADSPIRPIRPTGQIDKDIAAVKASLSGFSIFGVANTCLEPSLYRIKDTGARILMFSKNLNELAPAVINGDADASLLDVPDALIALSKWPGRVKVIGPVSDRQVMAVAFAKSSPALRKAFNAFLAQLKADGRYMALIKKYYPGVVDYYPDFFSHSRPQD